MGALSFRLNGEWRSVGDVPPTMTVLDYLRLRERLTGTKEGCAEGDCGACTVLLSRAGRDGPVHEAVNSCLMVVPQLDGRALTTVEGVSPRGTALGPVQAAMVAADATQCGFCTPGFVMAIEAFRIGGEPADESHIHEALAGNLCRCTGYRSIVESVKRAVADSSGSGPSLAGRSGAAEYRLGDQLYLAPPDLAGLLAALAAHPDARILAGGTDIGLRFSKDREATAKIVSTAAVAELHRVDETPAGLTIGGAATYSEALPLVDRLFPAFGALIRRIGSRQIRNLGTLAGNLANASPIGDTIPCLIALGATVELASAAGKRRIPVDAFILGYRKTALRPGEIIAAIEIPRLPAGETFAVYKLSKRFDQDISTVIGAFRARIEQGTVRSAALAFGGMAERARRAPSAEAALVGHPADPASFAAAGAAVAKDFSPLSDHRGSAAYRLAAAAGLVERFGMEATGASVPTRVEAL